MLKISDILPVGSMLSVVLEGDCKNIQSGSKLIDENGNIIIVDSVAMVEHTYLKDIGHKTIVLINKCDIKEGSTLSLM